MTKLGGEVLGRLPFERQDDDVLAFTPTPLRNLSQHRFEPILARRAALLGRAMRRATAIAGSPPRPTRTE